MPGKIIASLILTAGLAVAPATAGTLSFRSDDNHRGFTFQGVGNSITHAAQFDPYQLLIDDHNGPLAPVQFNVRLLADFTITPTGVVNIFGSILHTYALNGGFSFVDFFTGAPLLNAQVVNGAMTSPGNFGGWGTSGNLQGNDQPQSSSVTYQWFGPDLPGYQFFNGQSSVGLDDFGFTLTSITSGFIAPIAGVPVGEGGVPISTWASEGSFSGTAYFVPTPGAAGLMILGCLAANRRRR